MARRNEQRACLSSFSAARFFFGDVRNKREATLSFFSDDRGQRLVRRKPKREHGWKKRAALFFFVETLCKLAQHRRQRLAAQSELTEARSSLVEARSALVEARSS